MSFKNNLPTKTCRGLSRAEAKNDREYWQQCRIEVASRDVSYLYVNSSNAQPPVVDKRTSGNSNKKGSNNMTEGRRVHSRDGRIARRGHYTSHNNNSTVEIGVNMLRNRVGDKPTDGHYDRYNRTWLDKKYYTSRYPTSLRHIALEQGASFSVIETDLSHDRCVYAQTKEERRKSKILFKENSIKQYNNNEERAATRRAEQRKQVMIERIKKLVEQQNETKHKAVSQKEIVENSQVDIDSIPIRIPSVHNITVDLRNNIENVENKNISEIYEFKENDPSESNRNNANNVANRVDCEELFEKSYHVLDKNNIVFKKETPKMCINKTNIVNILNDDLIMKKKSTKPKKEMMDIDDEPRQDKGKVENMEIDGNDYDYILDKIEKMDIDDKSDENRLKNQQHNKEIEDMDVDKL